MLATLWFGFFSFFLAFAFLGSSALLVLFSFCRLLLSAFYVHVLSLLSFFFLFSLVLFEGPNGSKEGDH